MCCLFPEPKSLCGMSTTFGLLVLQIVYNSPNGNRRRLANDYIVVLPGAATEGIKAAGGGGRRRG